MIRNSARLFGVLLLALGAVACASESKGSNEAGGGRTSTPTPDESAQGSIEWGDCDGGDGGGSLECATLKVPVDYNEPDGDTLSLSVSRAPAKGYRTGALFVNPGGPGAAASGMVSYIASSLPPEVNEHFDIVGVDPRGIGGSEIDCGGDFTELYGLDYSIDSPEDETELIDTSQEYVDGCETEVGPDVLANLGTTDVARDMDQVREAMGDDQLSYLGYSYGTAIGQVYAQEFPDRMRAMILDGVLELGPSGVDLAKEQARAFEKALAAFVADCNSDSSCPIGSDAMAKVNELHQKVEQKPIAGGSRDLGPGDLAIAMAQPLYTKQSWPMLADAIDEALQGDGSAMIQLADDYLAIGNFDIYFAVNCLDFSWPGSPDELMAEGEAMASEAPHFGESIVNDYVRCSMWPVPEEPLAAVTAPGTPPILVISTTNDPATPYEAGVRTAQRLESGVLLTYEGEGHTVVASGVSCIDEKVAKYLVDLEPPENETRC